MHIQLNDQNQYLRDLPSGNIEFSPTVFQPAHTLTPEQAEQFRVHPLTPTEAPAFDPITHGVRAAAPVQVDGVWTQQWEVYPLPAEEQDANAQSLRASLVTQIDEAVAAIYGRFTRFAIEYQEREQQAQAYKDAGYTGTVPPRVAEFATPAAMSADDAADLILAQAANLRTAQGALSALRMRKYEVLRAATTTEAQAVGAEILAGIATVGAQVS